MIRFTSPFRRALAALVLAGLLAGLAGCHRGAAKDTYLNPQQQQQFDATIQAYKGGQFLVDGAVLSALDTGSHFAYLKDTGHLPKTVLLTPSDESKVRKQHLQFMARMQLDYGFIVYYDHKGELRRIDPVETKARALEDYHAPVKSNDEMQKREAGANSFDQQQQ